MPINIYGALRAGGHTLSPAGASSAVVGSTFQITAYSQVTITDGNDPTIINGDLDPPGSNEVPTDPTQILIGGGNAFYWDFTIEVTDGTDTYYIGVFDYDIDGNGNMIGVDNEDGYFLGFLDGQIPPLNTTLTIISIFNNGPNLPVDSVVPCFTVGTLISTPQGPRAIEALKPGDAVLTQDNAAQTIRWIGSRSLTLVEQMLKPKLRPVLIQRGALGQGLPERDLCVSPQHRMLVRSPIVQRMFAAEEILVAAHKLIGIPGISVAPLAPSVAYWHILFDRHEIIFAEGAPSESLFMGPQALNGVGAEAAEEIAALFPELLRPSHQPRLARATPAKGGQLRAMVQRHIKNDKPLLATTA